MLVLVVSLYFYWIIRIKSLDDLLSYDKYGRSKVQISHEFAEKILLN